MQTATNAQLAYILDLIKAAKFCNLIADDASETVRKGTRRKSIFFVADLVSDHLSRDGRDAVAKCEDANIALWAWRVDVLSTKFEEAMAAKKISKSTASAAIEILKSGRTFANIFDAIATICNDNKCNFAVADIRAEHEITRSKIKELYPTNIAELILGAATAEAEPKTTCTCLSCNCQFTYEEARRNKGEFEANGYGECGC